MKHPIHEAYENIGGSYVKSKEQIELEAKRRKEAVENNQVGMLAYYAWESYWDMKPPENVAGGSRFLTFEQCAKEVFGKVDCRAARMLAEAIRVIENEGWKEVHKFSNEFFVVANREPLQKLFQKALEVK